MLILSKFQQTRASWWGEVFIRIIGQVILRIATIAEIQRITRRHLVVSRKLIHTRFREPETFTKRYFLDTSPHIDRAEGATNIGVG